MRNHRILRNLTILVCIAFVITGVFYALNVLVFSSRRISPTDAFFIEGIIFLFFGFLLLLGKGGISLFSLKGAILSALAEGLFGADTVGPREMFERDAWKPDGFIKLSIILIVTGAFMLITYFATL